MNTIKPNSYIVLHYRVGWISDDGTDMEFLSTLNDRPATFELGKGFLPEWIEEKLCQMKEGDEQSFTLENAYGEHNATLVKQLPQSQLMLMSYEGAYEAGAAVKVSFNKDDQATGILIEQSQDKLSWVVDFNHPLAGKKVSAYLKVVGVLQEC